jgi:hypothetical protein
MRNEETVAGRPVWHPADDKQTRLPAGLSAEEPPPNIPPETARTTDNQTSPAEEPDVAPAPEEKIDIAAVSGPETPDLPPATDQADQPPPTDKPPAETGSPEPPNRGAMLQQLVDYVRVSYDETERAVALQAQTLEATGLRLDDAGENFELVVTHPGTFAEALKQYQLPEDDAARQNFHDQIEVAIEGALSDVSSVAIIQDPQQFTEIFGKDIPVTAVFAQVTQNIARVSEEQIRVAAGLPEYSGTLAHHLKRLEAPGHIVQAVEQLAIATKERVTDLWAAAYDIELIGHSDGEYGRIGEARFVTEKSWEPAFNYLRHLRRAEPDAEFTQNVRAAVVADLLAELIDTEVALSTEEKANIQALPDFLQEMANETDPIERMLRHALTTVQTILPARP